MGAPKSIDLGDGLRKQVSYEKLKSLLKKELAHPDAARRKVAQNALKDKFPAKFKAEQEAAHVADVRRINEKRWKCYLGAPLRNPPLEPYRIDHGIFLKKISQSQLNPRKHRRQNRVTDFTNWIYEVIHGPSDPAKQAAGKAAEREIAKARIKRGVPLSDCYSDWQLIDKDPLNEKPEAREISLLKVGNDSLYGAPDYAFYNPKEHAIIIVEIKFTFTNRPLPSDGWPNLRAQLWAYGCIDSYIKRARNIVLIGEIWGEAYNKESRKEGYSILHTYRWNMSDAEFCKHNEELFASYQNWVCKSGISSN